MSGSTRAGFARLNAYHGTKRQLIGTAASQVAPAWRTSNGTAVPAATNGSTPPLSKKALLRGSKILLSNLPMDVAEAEVEELFKRTIGPVKDLFIIYNNQARSKGMAVVTFQRPGDAGVAQSKYNGKVIDGKHKLKIELVTDDDEVAVQTTKGQSNAPPTASSLLSRIGGPLKQATSKQVASNQVPKNTVAMQLPQRPAMRISSAPIVIVSTPRKRTKKGPKRVKKSLAQLDQEMEEYRASATNGNHA